MNDFPAHIRYCDNIKKTHTVKQHSIETAEYAAKALEGKHLHLQNVAYLAGIIHDMGKYTEKFREYIEKASQDIYVKKGSVNHTYAGLIYLFEHFHQQNNNLYEKLTCEIIGYAVGAHHSLFDCESPDKENGFLHRLNTQKEEIYYNEAVYNYFSLCMPEPEIVILFKKASEEINSCIASLLDVSEKSSESFHFYIGMLTRLLLSAVIEGDRRSTAEFMGCSFSVREEKDKKVFWQEILLNIEDKISILDKTSVINKARSRISQACSVFANEPTGIYRLTVPTGGGKTISGLRYSVKHAHVYEKKSIFFVIPLLSVIEQNAIEIKKYVGNEACVLEHHSNVVNEGTPDEFDQTSLLIENWDSPIIITTLVQLLDTLFSNKTTCIRRMHSLYNSVIFIDEIQSLPVKTIYLFNEAMNFLNRVCNATIILSSATQPGFDRLKESKLKLADKREIIPFDKEMWSIFKRNRVIDECCAGGYSIDEVAGLAMKTMQKSTSLLIICNTKTVAKDIFREIDILNRNTEKRFDLYHLSTSMCPQHRTETLNEIKANLGKTPVVCVSTQLVEAGIDFSFENVIRIRAGLDSIAQAAGRCNRSNEYDRICEVKIINIKNESLKNLKEIQCAQEATKQVLYSYSVNPDRFDNDILSQKAIDSYYTAFFNQKEINSRFSYPLPDNFNILELLSENSSLRKEKDFIIAQSFKTACENFKVFDDDTYDIIVPYNKEAESIIADIYSERAKHDIMFLKDTLTRAKRYTISVYGYQLSAFERSGGINYLHDKKIITMLPNFYSKSTGAETENIY